MSYDYVGDLSETVALMWPAPAAARNYSPSLSEVVETLLSAGKLDLPRHLTHWLDGLDETGRWALLKLITGALRIGVSARLAKTAVADPRRSRAQRRRGSLAWARAALSRSFCLGRGSPGQARISRDPAPFRTPMLAHAIERQRFCRAGGDRFFRRMEMGRHPRTGRGRPRRGGKARCAALFAHRRECFGAFPDLLDTLDNAGPTLFAIDGELLIVREGRVAPFAILQQRLNRKNVSAKLLLDYPAHIRAYDLLAENGEDLRPLPFSERRTRLETLIARLRRPRIDLSPLVPFSNFEELARFRHDPRLAGAEADAAAIEGLMLKRRDSFYVPGRPKGLWFKWKRDPHVVDAVLMYAQRGHGKRSSYYSDYTFGVWRKGAAGDELVPVGKAYFGFTDAELVELDRYVRHHTTNRFGPVREIAASKNEGLVLEIAFEGLARSTRHKSGVAMRFPRISRIRKDKPARDADRIETLEKLLVEER